MTAMNGLYNVEYNTEMLKRRSFMKHYFNMSSIKTVSHELVLKIDSLTSAALIEMRHVLFMSITSTVGESCLAQYHITICGRHIITNLILQSTLNFYPISLHINRFLVFPRDLPISENVVDK
jgi:hypothetical protein